jgi:ferritin-like metal-binding protein YciE
MAANDIKDQLITYLKDAHALEQNALAQLKAGAEAAGDPALSEAFREHLAETEEHDRLISERLESYGETSSSLKDMAHKGAAMMSGMTAKAAPDTTGKLAIQAYAFEHIEIASYRMLSVVAERAGDHETAEVAQRILQQEQEAAAKLEGLLEPVAEYDLRQVGVAA